ncbi:MULTISPECIES: intradiol ring-cleavage dioxygenase [unclassified Caballeronia]|uniref:intradiol ring-cleavage dioxygenase n=1 Tax=unclassified Caballeronia TaxID=2646786 RepID=UPI00025BCB4F|nr:MULTISPECIES: intradiol ring-cleavage dioxygenase [unclassified Caballeronia]MCE4546423.1 intradiol ring-cleavage dioxygenase [Caballeronia sp. PC1]MCE4573103.1 intradiol ring-cleavage dioxygenase [Caballeronia sp. CLC5]
MNTTTERPMAGQAVHPITDTVLATLSSCTDARVRQLMTALIRHLHAFAQEVQLTGEEWRKGIEFLTATGKKCDGIRQEFILLSDTLGLSIMLDEINQRDGVADSATTESSLLGPFYREGAFDEEYGANIARTEGEPTLFHGRVVDDGGEPVADALIEVWETANNGMYEGQDPDQPESNLRGRFRSGPEGEFAFRAIKPTAYPIPTDGPVGQMLLAVGRHPMRPGHVHFLIQAPGYETLTTALYSADDPYVRSDAVFGVKSSLVVDYVRNVNREEAKKWDLPSPFFDVKRDFVLSRANA